MRVTQGNPECVPNDANLHLQAFFAPKEECLQRKMPVGYQKLIRCEEALQGAGPVPKQCLRSPVLTGRKTVPKWSYQHSDSHPNPEWSQAYTCSGNPNHHWMFCGWGDRCADSPHFHVHMDSLLEGKMHIVKSQLEMLIYPRHAKPFLQPTGEMGLKLLGDITTGYYCIHPFNCSQSHCCSWIYS